MELFEFLMILLSIIVGLGIAEILSGVARSMKSDGIAVFSWTHGAAAAAVFLGLLQMFWETWGLLSIETWSFPAMLLMLGSPICLFLIAHLLFPERDSSGSLEDHYFERARLIWALAGATVIIGTLFRPLAFGAPLWIVDNLSGAPMLVVCAVLSIAKNRRVHHVLVPVLLALIAVDTLALSYTIQ